jgi:PAS domain S-box-containing protein
MRGAVIAGEALTELLADLSEAPDFAAAASLLLEQLTVAVGASRGILFVVDGTHHRLELRGSIGLSGAATLTTVPLSDEGHPVALAARMGAVVACNDGAKIGLPFERCLILSLPQSRYNRVPSPPGRRGVLDPRFPCCTVVSWPGEDQRGPYHHATFGAIAIDGVPDAALVAALAGAARHAGPMIARVATLDELRRSSDRVHKQRDLLTSIINALPDPIAITDGQGRALVQNRRAEALLASRDDDSEGRRRAVEINNLLFSSFLARAVLTGTGGSAARELNLVDPIEGTDLLFEVLAHPLPASVRSGGDGSYVSVLRDVTDLKAALIELERQYHRARVTEAEATRERDRLNVILQNVGEPILVTDESAKILLMNPQAEQLLEAPPGVTDQRQLQRIRGNDTKFSTFISDFALGPGMLRRERLTLVHPREGRDIPMEVVATKVMNTRGEPMAIVSVLHDLTQQVENERLNQELRTLNQGLEDRIRIATADLEERNLRLQWQSSELEKAYRLKSEFLASISHELRTPINALIGYTALMLDRIYGELTPKQVEGLTRIQASSQHLLALINDVLDLSKIEAGKMPVRLEPVGIRPILLEVAAQVEPLVRRKSLAFRLGLDEHIPVIYTDPTKVKQIVLNLLSNAVKFTNRGTISLTATPVGASLVIRVSDTGIGIRPEHLDMIFEEFRQVDQSRTREYGGTGLGLSITRKLVSLLGGGIAVESEFGRGTTFMVTLPLHREGVGPDRPPLRAPIGAADPSS